MELCHGHYYVLKILLTDYEKHICNKPYVNLFCSDLKSLLNPGYYGVNIYPQNSYVECLFLIVTVFGEMTFSVIMVKWDLKGEP